MNTKSYSDEIINKSDDVIQFIMIRINNPNSYLTEEQKALFESIEVDMGFILTGSIQTKNIRLLLNQNKGVRLVQSCDMYVI